MGVRVPPFASYFFSAMKHFLLSFFFLFSSLYAEPIDSSLKSFALKETKKFRVDTFDFSGDYPDLENIEIDAKRKKCVELLLPGSYPQLEKIDYEGTFGSLEGKLTGSFPKLYEINILTLCAAMQLDFSGKWEQSCTINLRGSRENIVLSLPQQVGVILNVKTRTGKVITNQRVKKQGWGVFNRVYTNEESVDAPILLTVNVELDSGQLILK